MAGTKVFVTWADEEMTEGEIEFPEKAHIIERPEVGMLELTTHSGDRKVIFNIPALMMLDIRDIADSE